MMWIKNSWWLLQGTMGGKGRKSGGREGGGVSGVEGQGRVAHSTSCVKTGKIRTKCAVTTASLWCIQPTPQGVCLTFGSAASFMTFSASVGALFSVAL